MPADSPSFESQAGDLKRLANYEKHALIRTSSFSQVFIGTCLKCGRKGMSTQQALLLTDCPNPTGVTAEELWEGIRSGVLPYPEGWFRKP